MERTEESEVASTPSNSEAFLTMRWIALISVLAAGSVGSWDCPSIKRSWLTITPGDKWARARIKDVRVAVYDEMNWSGRVWPRFP